MHARQPARIRSRHIRDDHADQRERRRARYAQQIKAIDDKRGHAAGGAARRLVKRSHARLPGAKPLYGRCSSYTQPKGFAMTAATATATAADPMNLTGVLDEIENRAHAEAQGDGALSVADLFDAVGRRSFGPVLLAIGVFAISPATAVPGLTWVSAALSFVVCAHIAVGAQRLWLPRKFLDVAIPEQPLVTFIDKLRPSARSIDKVLKPRLTFLTNTPFVNLVGLTGMLAALVTFPLGFVPFAPLLPGIATVLIGLGMTARDGVVILLGAAMLPFAGYTLYTLFF
ncbi:MAG: hypothetical protein GC189_06840 [Alphaproteobacteria bacterium]|nr:hypothetical protein [Alphaproteobacteria bacterium]